MSYFFFFLIAWYLASSQYYNSFHTTTPPPIVFTRISVMSHLITEITLSRMTCACGHLGDTTVCFFNRMCCTCTPLYINPWWWPYRGRNMYNGHKRLMIIYYWLCNLLDLVLYTYLHYFQITPLKWQPYLLIRDCTHGLEEQGISCQAYETTTLKNTIFENHFLVISNDYFLIYVLAAMVFFGQNMLWLTACFLLSSSSPLCRAFTICATSYVLYFIIITITTLWIKSRLNYLPVTLLLCRKCWCCTFVRNCGSNVPNTATYCVRQQYE